MSSIYSEVTATYSRDRVLEKFDTTLNTLPYTLDDIKISHNDLLLANVYNDTITKLYFNYLFLIANAEITTKTSPTTALSSYNFSATLTANADLATTATSGTASLSTINELHFLKRGNTNEKIVFSYGTDNSLIYKISENNQTVTSLLSGNNVEFNKQFKFSNVVSVDSFNNLLFVLDKGNNTLFKFDISGLIYSDPPVERVSIDSDLPGRFLLKTIGGKGKVNRKNKLTDPSSISIFNEKIYVLDNGNFTIKVFDLNFNFINSYTNKEIFDYNPISINVSESSDLDSSGKIFILGKNGSIITCDTNFNNITLFDIFSNYTSRLDPAKTYNEGNNFKKIISSPSQKNILYVTTNKSVVKLYKTNLTIPISFYDNSVFNLNTSYEFIDSLDVDSISGVDNLVLFSHLSSGETKYSLFKDKNETNKLYHENFYTNYFSLSDINIKSQELVNAISFNKTTEKILYNHSSFFENINKKIYSFYTDTRVPEICTVVEATYSVPSNFNVTSDFYIGVNEPLLTDVINRPITKLYNQQEALFDILKEDFLNTNPPANIPEVLPSSIDIDDLPIMKFNPLSADAKVTGGDPAMYEVIRNKTDRESKFKIYTTADTGTLTSDYDHFTTDDDYIYTFEYGVSGINVDISTGHFYSGDPKGFTTSLYAPSGGIILQSQSSRVTTMTGSGDLYTVSLSTDGPDPIAVENGTPARFAVTRSNNTGTYTQDTSVNIFTSHISTVDDDIVTISTDGAYLGSTDDFGNFPGFAPQNNYQVFANTLSGGTVIFTENVSAVFFDVSAKADTVSELQESFTVNICNPSQGSKIVNDSHRGFVNEESKSVSLTVDSSYPTNYNSTDKLSGVNIWYLLSADTIYKTYSAEKAMDVSLTITSPLTVYSPSADRGAIYFDAKETVDPLKLGSKLTIIIPETSLVIGKGGNGGTGLIWLSGQGFDEDTATIPVSTVDDLEDSDFQHWGQDGGPAVSLSGFNYLTISNSGSAIGGAGGGGAGFLAVSANPMPEVSALSASSGGGGGAGIEPNGYGIGGIRHPGGTFGTLTVEAAPFVCECGGCNGSITAGGAGGITSGTIGGYNTDLFCVMDGADGGSIGYTGGGDDQPDNVTSYPTCYDTVSGSVLRFGGGDVGNIVQPGVNWYTKPQDTTTGTFSGFDI